MGNNCVLQQRWKDVNIQAEGKGWIIEEWETELLRAYNDSVPRSEA